VGKFYLSIAMKKVRNRSYWIQCQLGKSNCRSTDFYDAANLALVLTLHSKLELDFHSILVLGIGNSVSLICISSLHLDAHRFVQ